MHDLDWERSKPILDIDVDEIVNIFSEYKKDILIIDFSPIQSGCRNSNYVVNTSKGKYLLRISDKHSFNNEITAFEIVKKRINVPDLFFNKTKGEYAYHIYQYISGVSLQKHIIDNRKCDKIFLEQVAKAAAIIHNTPKEETNKLKTLDVPPYEIWYQVFLDNPTVRDRIGLNLCKRIQRLVTDKYKLISQIDSYKSFIHGDFRPLNMLVDENRSIYFIDWEASWWGHTLADIGQFFRYRTFFSNEDIHLFEKIYNAYADKKLPSNWFELSLFRDLVNPLQLLSIKNETPLRNADLINVIEGILAFWNS
ncbi:MAG: aminoglycoside phosphotransferase family protein [Clostridia bacterium]|nr:aminoglycoside phosphotransferase family protein [Clostridia bacterium]